jgi:DNA adenine methylase
MEDPIQKAARFIYLNRHCFNGLYRTNLAGQFNVPRGCKTGNVPQEEVFWRCSRALRSATLLAADFEETMNHVRANDFVYLDPPYHVTNRRVFRDYIPGSFGAADLQRLSLALNAVHSVGAKFLLSYADCSDARSLFGGWHVRRITVARNIAGFAGNRKRAVELMVSNYIACPG